MRQRASCRPVFQALGWPSESGKFQDQQALWQQAGRERGKSSCAKCGSCRGVFQALDWDQGWKLQGVFKPCVEVLTKGTGIETPCGNRRGWKREGLRQQAGQERGKSRCGKGGVFFKPLGFSAGCPRPQTALSNVIFWTVGKWNKMKVSSPSRHLAGRPGTWQKHLWGQWVGPKLEN